MPKLTLFNVTHGYLLHAGRAERPKEHMTIAIHVHTGCVPTAVEYRAKEIIEIHATCGADSSVR